MPGSSPDFVPDVPKVDAPKPPAPPATRIDAPKPATPRPAGPRPPASRNKTGGKRAAAANLERSRAMRRAGVHVGGVVLLLLALGAGFFFMRRYVEREVAFTPRPPAVVLKNRPPWMTDFLAMQIAAGVRPGKARSAFDRQLLVDVTRSLKTNPWIRKVNSVRRAYGRRPGDTLEVDCEYREPVALVESKSSGAAGAPKSTYWLVDAQGVKLPEAYAAADVPKLMETPDRRTHIRIIEGVRRPAPKAGHRWGGDDVAAGLRMVALLNGRNYADDVYKVNVENFEGRRDARAAHVVLVTKYNTQVWWGQAYQLDAIEDGVVEVKWQRKLAYMKGLHEEYGRVDAAQPWVDLRRDTIFYPDAPPAQAAQRDGAQANIRP